jgi:hypothetical protein
MEGLYRHKNNKDKRSKPSSLAYLPDYTGVNSRATNYKREEDVSASGMTASERMSDFAETGDLNTITPADALAMQLDPELVAQVPGATAEDIQNATKIHAFRNNTNTLLSNVDTTNRPPAINTNVVEPQPRTIPGPSAEKITQNMERFLAYARDEGEEYWEYYDSTLGGGGHPLEFCSAEQIDTVITELIKDGSIPWQRKASIFSEMLDTLTPTPAEAVFHALVEMSADEDVYTQSQALQALTELAGNLSSYSLYHYYDDPEFSPTDAIAAVSEKSKAYFVLLRANKLLNAYEQTDQADIDTIHEYDWLEFKLSNQTKAKFDDWGNIRLIDSEGGNRKLEASDLTNRPLSIEEANQALFNYQFMMRGDIRAALQEDFGVDVTQLSLKEQYQFLNYVLKVDLSKIQEIRYPAERFGSTFARTFLSLELECVDSTLGDKIVAFGSEHPQAEEVFTSYSSLLGEVNKLESLIQSELDCTKVDCVLVSEKAKKRLLEDTHQYLINAIQSNQTNVVNGLDEIATQAKALSSAFSTYLAEGQSSIEDFNSFEKSVYAGGEIKEQLHSKIQDVYRGNYRALGYEEEAVESLVSTLNKKLSNPETRVRTWQFGERQILAFIASTEHPEEKSVYLSGLNINPNLKVAQAAKNLLEETIADYSKKGWVIEAECSPKIFQGYGEMDWVATGVKEDDLGAEDYLLDIAIYPQQAFTSKKMARKDLRELVVDVDEAIGPDGVMVWRTNDPSETPPLLHQGYVATRMFRDKKIQPGQTCYIFALEKFTPPQLSATEPQTQIAA